MTAVLTFNKKVNKTLLSALMASNAREPKSNDCMACLDARLIQLTAPGSRVIMKGRENYYETLFYGVLCVSRDTMYLDNWSQMRAFMRDSYRTDTGLNVRLRFFC